MRRLEAAAWAAVEAQFLADDAWMAGVYGTPRLSDETLQRAVVAGSTRRRRSAAPPPVPAAAPAAAPAPALPRGEPSRGPVPAARPGPRGPRRARAKGAAFDEDLDGAELIARVQAVEGFEGVDYEASWRRCYDGVAASQSAPAATPELFAYAVRDEDMRVLDPRAAPRRASTPTSWRTRTRARRRLRPRRRRVRAFPGPCCCRCCPSRSGFPFALLRCRCSARATMPGKTPRARKGHPLRNLDFRFIP